MGSGSPIRPATHVRLPGARPGRKGGRAADSGRAADRPAEGAAPPSPALPSGLGQPPRAGPRYPTRAAGSDAAAGPPCSGHGCGRLRPARRPLRLTGTQRTSSWTRQLDWPQQRLRSAAPTLCMLLTDVHRSGEPVPWHRWLRQKRGHKHSPLPLPRLPWFSPRRQLSTTRPHTHPLVGWGRESAKQK